MTARLKSAVLSRTNSFRRTTLSGVKDSIRSVRLSTDNDAPYASNEYIHRSFFDDDNYQAIIKCLNDGYKVSANLIDSLQDYCDLERDHAEKLSSYSSKSTTKLKQLSTLSSYHTTKRAQMQILRSPNKVAELIQSRCDDMQGVINTYQQQVDRMYPSERLGTVHKHYRAERLRKAFKLAYSPMSNVAEKLEKLYEQERRAKEALHDADVQCENLREDLGHDVNGNKNKIARATDNKEKRQYELQRVQDEIARAEKEHSQAQETYRANAMKIYNDCRECEKERLDQIRETLISFCQAAHASEYSAKQNALFEDLIMKIESQQNSIEDLDFWAETYHVISAKKTVSSETINNDENDSVDPPTTTPKDKKSAKNDNVTAVADSAASPAVENDDEQSAKTKQNKNKKSTTTDKKSSVSTEPATPITTKAQLAV